MNYEEFLQKMTIIQQEIEEYIERNNENDENNNLINIFTKKQFLKDRLLLRSTLILLSNLTKNHYRRNHFLSKIRKIFQYIKSDIIAVFSNSELFDIFKNQKIILLLLVEEKILSIDQSIFDIISKGKYAKFHYPEFFYPEIKQYIDESTNQSILKELPPNFENLRKKGENDSKICQIIREDSLQEFIVFIHEMNIPLDGVIKQSIFETNSFLLKNDPTIIEYAAFYGSIQIFKYLFLKNDSSSPSLWIYGIHSNNPEIISFLEEKCLKPEDKTYEECLEESIKCHHNEFTDFFLSNYIDEKDVDDFYYNVYSYAFHYRNFLYFPKDQNYEYSFYYACQYDYLNIVENYLKDKDLEINRPIEVHEIKQIFFHLMKLIKIFYLMKF